MRSRPARLTLSALAWIALGAAAFFTVTTQKTVDQRRTLLRAFEATARDAADALDDAQAGQQAYVATGQDPADWYAKVSTYVQTASTSIDALRATATSPAAAPLLLEASTTLTQFGRVDRTVREHIASEDLHAAADAIFGDASEAIGSAVADLDAALAAEQQSLDTFEAAQRQRLVYAAGGAAGFAALSLLLLALARPAVPAAESTDEEEAAPANEFSGLSLHEPLTHRTEEARREPSPAPATGALTSMAAICTGFGRVREAGELAPLLEQAAAALNARGLIVWLGSAAGADLRPVLAHGYSERTLARIPTLTRTADNAAAAAYRTGDIQVVGARPNGANGTVVAPLVTSEGCIGAMTAEIRDGGEQSDATRALATILAAQLAGLLAPAAASAAAAPADVQSAIG
ncbi:MAG: hypothetical protein U0Q55_18925 [Vicinamibacterales bacterium]